MNRGNNKDCGVSSRVERRYKAYGQAYCSRKIDTSRSERQMDGWSIIGTFDDSNGRFASSSSSNYFLFKKIFI